MANRIKELRLAMGLNKTQLAAKLGTAKSTIKRLEEGERRLDDVWVERLSKFFGVRRGELFDEYPRELDSKAEILVDVFDRLPDSQKDLLIQLAENMARPYEAEPEVRGDKSHATGGKN